MLRSVVLISLPLLSIAGAYGTWVLGAQNGTFQILTDILSQRHAQFPGTEATLVRHYTMISAIDHQLQILVAFFAPVVGSGNNSLVLFGIMGAGQFGATWTLLMMESQRLGNKGKLVSLLGLPSPDQMYITDIIAKYWHSGPSHSEYLLHGHSTSLSHYPPLDFSSSQTGVTGQQCVPDIRD